MSGLRVGSLFSGYGGLDLACEEAFGATTAWVSDIDPGACKILAHRYPDLPNHGDITKIDWNAVEPVDILTGGSPCQDLSHAGKRGGMTEGTRSNLWVSMRESIAALRPRYVVWENVRGAYSAEADSDLGPCPGCLDDPRERGPVLRALGRVLGDLSSLGYDSEWVGLRAADVGAPHGRFRVFVLASDTLSSGRDRWSREARRTKVGGTAADGRPEGPLLPTPRSTDGDKALRTRAGAAAEFARKGTGSDLTTMLALLPTPAVNDMGEGKTVSAWDEWTAKMRRAHGNGNGHGASLAIELQRVSNGWGPYAAAIARWEPIIGRKAPSPSEGARVREWMMGLPEGWVTDVPDLNRNAQLKALGNGVVSQQCYAALVHMLNAERMAA